MKTLRQLVLVLPVVLLLACGSDEDGEDGVNGNANPNPSQQPSVGIPDQNSMSLAVSEFNVDCYNTDGVTSDISVRLADQLNNNSTIPDGTIVYFAAEGGAVDSQCETENGACSVVWTCQAHRPANGRVTLLAWTLGTESFNDNNSNGFFDSGDTMVSETDRGEPYIDKNEDGVRDLDEEFVNYPNPGLNTGGTYDLPDGLYSGVNCAFPGQCADNQSIFIYRQTVLVMSVGQSQAVIIPIEKTVTDTEYQLYTGADPVDLDGGVTLLFLITDALGNALPVGTSVDFEASIGETPGNTSFSVPNTTATAAGNGPPWEIGAVSPLVFGVRIDETTDNAIAENGVLKISIEVDGGASTEDFVELFDPAN